VGNLVSRLVDFPGGGGLDNVTDPDAGALLGVAVTAADTSNGIWWYSTDNGTTWTALGTVSDSSARLLAADAGTRLYFQPNPNYSGTLSTAITFHAWDRTTGSNGGLADTTTTGGSSSFSAASDTASLTILTQQTGVGRLVVTTANDLVDGDTSSVANLLANQGADGKISLREAILAANSTPGMDEIDFAIGAGGLRTLNITSALPAITDAVLIDGWTQPGFAGTPLILLDGVGAGANVDGLTLGAGSSGSTIRGLIIDSFSGGGILIRGGSAGNTIIGNYLGTDANGLVARGNGTWGIDLNGAGSGNIIGGSTAAARNVISGNSLGAIALNGSGVTGTVIQGNYIGVGADGTTPLGNSGYGGLLILSNSTSTTIGGTNPGA
jgi:hypothetical protein